jgi:hypothetical protein
MGHTLLMMNEEQDMKTSRSYLKVFCAVAFMALPCADALAQTAAFTTFNDANVSVVRRDEDGRSIITLQSVANAKVISGTPACTGVPAYARAYAFRDKGMLSVALAAKAAGYLVNAVGAGVCTVYGNSLVEDLYTLEIK